MKIFLPAIFLFFIFSSVYGQHEGSVFTSSVTTTFETDYHAVGVNPANLGFPNKYKKNAVTVGLVEIALSAYSGSLTKKEFAKSLSDKASGNFTDLQKWNAAALFTDKNLSLNADLNWLGISYQNDKLGGFAFNIKESVSWYSSFGKELSEILYLGYKAPYFDSLRLGEGKAVANTPANHAYADSAGILEGFVNDGNQRKLSQLYDGSRVYLLYYMEYNLSYGKVMKLSDAVSLAAGAGIKYIKGYGMMNIEVQDNRLVALAAFPPVSDFYSSKGNNAHKHGQGYHPVGKGVGFDGGLTVVIKEKLKAAVALTNVGSITWNKHLYTVQDSELSSVQTEGLQSYNISEASRISSSNEFLKWQGAKKTITALPSVLRIGGSYLFLNKKLELGGDLMIPMNSVPGALVKPYWAVGGDVLLTKFLRASSGLAHGGNFGERYNIPLGFTFVIGKQGLWEFGLATRDVITYFRSDTPVLSLSYGFLRFRL